MSFLSFFLSVSATFCVSAISWLIFYIVQTLLSIYLQDDRIITVIPSWFFLLVAFISFTPVLSTVRVFSFLFFLNIGPCSGTCVQAVQLLE